MTTPSWKPVLMGLLLVKTVYLSGIALLLALWPEFDADRAAAVNAIWFEQSADPTPGHAAGLARHFATWDAQHYLFLSQAGYRPGVRSCAFFPLWPILIRWAAALTGGSHLIAGLVLANVFSLAAWLLFYQVTRARFGESLARWALVLLIAFPGALFYQFIYTESLFFLLVMVLWYGLERRRYGPAWVAAFLLPLTRAIGVFAVLPIAWHWLDRWRWLANERQRFETEGGAPSNGRAWGANALLLAAPLGLGLYFALMAGWTGNPFEGFEAQRFWRAHSISNLWNLPQFIGGFLEPTSWHAFRGSVLDRSAFVLLVCCLPQIWRLGKDLMIWTYVLGILPAMSGTFVSFTRFESTVFPLFIALGVWTGCQQPRWIRCAPVATFAVLHLVLLWRFVNFRWAG